MNNYLYSPVVDANLAIYGYYEGRTNVQTYSNRFFNNRIETGVTGGSLVAYTIVAGNNSQVDKMKASEVYAANTIASFYIKDGQEFFLTATGGARNFNPADTFPVNYKIVVHNQDAANAITFDSTGLTKSITAGSTGIFIYNGTAWKRRSIKLKEFTCNILITIYKKEK